MPDQKPSPLRILFSPHLHREPDLREALPGWQIDFLPLDSADPSSYDLVVPLDLDGIHAFNRHHRALHGTRALVPASSVAMLFDDKLRFIRALRRLGFGRYVAPTVTEADWPLVLKPRHGEWGDGIRLLHDADALRDARPLLDAGSHFLEPYATGRVEYVAHLVMHAGRLRYLRCFESHFDRDHYIHGRECRRRELRDADHRGHARLFEGILATLGFEGIGCFNYKLVDGTPRLFEFNPRYGASLSLRATEVLGALAAVLALPGHQVQPATIQAPFRLRHLLLGAR